MSGTTSLPKKRFFNSSKSQGSRCSMSSPTNERDYVIARQYISICVEATSKSSNYSGETRGRFLHIFLMVQTQTQTDIAMDKYNDYI